MLQNAEQTTLTVTENGETSRHVYALAAGASGSRPQQAIAAGFTADERMDPAVFAQKSMADKLQWRSQAHTQPGPVRVDTVRYTDEAVVSDLEALSRHPAQDAYMTFADEKFCVVDEVPGNELQLEPVRAALREAASGLTVDARAARRTRDFELTSVPDCYAAPEITAENTSFDFDELLRQMLSDLSYHH